MQSRVTQDRQVMVESSDEMWSTGDWNGKALQYSCLENPKNSMKRQKDILIIIWDWNVKVGSQEIRGETGKFAFGVQNEADYQSSTKRMHWS